MVSVLPIPLNGLCNLDMKLFRLAVVCFSALTDIEFNWPYTLFVLILFSVLAKGVGAVLLTPLRLIAGTVVNFPQLPSILAMVFKQDGGEVNKPVDELLGNDPTTPIVPDEK